MRELCYLCQTKNITMTTRQLPNNNENAKIHFAVLAMGAAANRMKTTPTDVYRRLKKYDLINKLLFGCYDVLHAESIDGVVWNVEEALKNRES